MYKLYDYPNYSRINMLLGGKRWTWLHMGKNFNEHHRHSILKYVPLTKSQMPVKNANDEVSFQIRLFWVDLALFELPRILHPLKDIPLKNKCGEDISWYGELYVFLGSQRCLGKASKVGFLVSSDPSLGLRKTNTFSSWSAQGTNPSFRGAYFL